MATMQGTDKTPFPRDRRLSEEQRAELTDRQKQYFQERLKAWKEFKESPMGKACLTIAEAKLKELLQILTAPTYELCMSFNLDPSGIEVIRDEARGRYAVWDEIVNDQQRIFEGLARLQVEEAKQSVKKSGLLVPEAASQVIRAR